MKIVVVDGARYDLDKCYLVPNSSTRENHGVSREAVYITPRTKRVLVETDSIWESGRHDGTTVGTQYHFADDNEIADLAAELGDERLLELVPLSEDAIDEK